MTKRRIAPTGGIGGWFAPTPSEWAVIERAYGVDLSPPARDAIAAAVARYTEEAEREAEARGTDEIGRLLQCAKDRAETLRGDLAALGDDNPLSDAIDNEMAPRSLDELRSLLFQFMVAGSTAMTRLQEADVKPGNAWKDMVGRLDEALDALNLPVTISYQEASQKASSFVRLVMAINELMRPRYRQRLHPDQLAALTQRLKEARRRWKKKTASGR